MVSEKRLIDAHARIEEIKKAQCNGCDNYGGVRCRACWVDDAIGLIDDAPTVDAVEVVHARWEYIPIIDGLGRYRCERCFHYVDAGTDRNYCPNCGAKMDGERREGE